MAFCLFLVPAEQIYEFQDGTRDTLKPSQTAYCSHLVAYWVPEQPLGAMLGEAVDGGAVLRSDLWHPLLEPAFHSVERVRDIEQRLTAAWKQFVQEHGELAAGDWYQGEISAVIGLFTHAVAMNE